MGRARLSGFHFRRLKLKDIVKEITVNFSKLNRPKQIFDDANIDVNRQEYSPLMTSLILRCLIIHIFGEIIRLLQIQAFEKFTY